MKIKLKINADSVATVNKLIEQIYYASNLNQEAKVVQSICFEVANKFHKSYKTAIENNNLFDSSKKQTITLKYHEAFALERLIMLLIHTVNDDLAKAQLNQIKDFINQKLA